MPSLEQSLHKHDLGHLRIIAQFWGIELEAGERGPARDELSIKMLNSFLATEVIEALLPEARNAVNTLVQNQGRVSWSLFEREFGKLSEIGAGKRDREKTYLNPASATETLFYRALLARAFFDSPNGAQEFAYIPDDLFAIIRNLSELSFTPKKELGRLARPNERTHILPANDHILDDLTTLLASLRLGWENPPFALKTYPRFARDLLLAAILIKKDSIQTDAIKSHLQLERADALKELIQIWRKSDQINELHQVPSLISEGEWTNPILDTREAIFSFLERIPSGKWWSLKAFIADIKKEHPDFQRTAGDYDAWFIRQAEDDTPLRGFEHWDEVEGALLHYFITGVLYWLGFVELASAKKNGEIKAFKIIEKPVKRLGEKGKIIISSSGLITISRFAPRVARYQISRFCKWRESKIPKEYRYQITPPSLERAKEQGLKVSHLLGILKKFADVEIPPTLARALRRWEVSGTEAQVETLSVLRLSKAEDLRKLRESKAGRFLGEVLSPTRVVVKAGASQKVMAALIEMGIFMQDEK